jgi:uncharacterized OsmC-like protein
MAAVAENKGVTPEKLGVYITRQILADSIPRTHFLIKIDLGQGLSQRERVILYNSARRCEVYQLLTGEKTFEYELLEAGDPVGSSAKHDP